MNDNVQLESAAKRILQNEIHHLPELLAPAGDWECAKAAVENGADAIYFGLDKFNARMRAHNFTEADLPKLMEFLHRRGVKGYVTFNTLVFENELAGAKNYLRAIIAAGVDAAIVQDVGICKMIRSLSPDFPIHASTQMTISSAAGVEFARNLGCNLTVLARECSIKEIGQMTNLEFRVANESAAADANSQFAIRNSKFPLEVFVHGALCVAYSGQCLTSESLGGRSANRGECAQACRMPYDLISDGQQVPLGDKRYLLSPQDLSGLEVLPELVRAGVSSLKIEGRLKSPEYVASITKVYRKALDDLRFLNDDLRAADESARQSEIVNRKYETEMSFSRGLFTGWFGGTDNQKLVHARFGKKRGVFLGAVAKVLSEGVVIQLQSPLKLGDGVVFDAGRPDEKEEGGRVGVIAPHGVLFRGGGEGRIRKALIEENLLDAVIGLPEKLFFGTGIPAVILLFKKGRNTKDVLFIDASGEYLEGTNQNRLGEDHIKKVVATYRAFQTVPKYSYRATREEIAENDFNLNIPRYVDTFEAEKEVDLKAVQKEIETLESQLTEVRKQMAEYLKELGLEKG